MKVRLITQQTVKNFAAEHAASVSSFNRWIRRIENADWENVNEIIGSFPSADTLGKGSNRVVFNVGGNNYRIICKYHFGKKMVHLFVCWIGTHAEYTKLCEEGNQYSIEKY